MAKKTEKPRTELPSERSGPPETPMPTGSGVLASRPQPAGTKPGLDSEAAERRRFRRAIKEKT